MSLSVVSAESLNNSHSTVENDFTSTNNVKQNSHINIHNINNLKNSSDSKIINKKYKKMYKDNDEEYFDNYWWITLNPLIGYANNKTTFHTEISSGHNINNGSFNYYLNNQLIGNSPIKNNKSSLEYKIPKDYEGEYTVKVIYINPNNKITEHEYYQKFIVYSEKSIIVDTDFKNRFIPLDEEEEITVYLKNYRNETLNKSGNIKFSLSYGPVKGYQDTTVIDYYPIKNGICKFNFTLKDEYSWEDNYPKEVTYNFDYVDNMTNKNYHFESYHTAMYREDMFWNTEIITKNVTAYAGQKVTFKGEIIDEFHNPVKRGRVVIKLNYHTIKSDLNLNNTNKFSFNYIIPKNYSAKTYKLSYVFVATGEYERSESKNILRILKKQVKIISNNVSTYAGKQISLTGKVLNNQKAIKNGRIVVKLNGKTLNSNISLNKRGEFSYIYKIPNFAAKKYKLSYVYVENKNYARYELNNTLTIKNQESKITANNIVAYPDNVVTFTINVTGAKTGIRAVSGNVGLKINGKTFKQNGKVFIQKIRNGTVLFKYKIPSNLKTGKYQITVTYSGGRNLFANNLNTSTLTIKDHTTLIKINPLKMKAGKSIKIIIKVFDSKGMIKTGNAIFKINKKKIGSNKISNGTATLNYKIPENFHGKYLLEVLARGSYTDLNKTKTTLTVY